MKPSIAKLKAYTQKLFTRREKFSLVQLMSDFDACLWECVSLRSGVKSFELIEPYYNRIHKLLNEYILNKKSSKNPMRRRGLRKKTAREFFGILESLGGIIPKWLLAIPDKLSASDFPKWKAKTEKGENRELVKYIKNVSQAHFLRNNLLTIADHVANTSANERLKKLVMRKIEKDSMDGANNLQIGAPTIVKK